LIEEYEMQLKEEEIKATQAKKASKIKGRSQLIVDDDLVITGKEYSTWLEDSSSIVRPKRRVKIVCPCLIACNFCFKIVWTI
jgi:hypothetical protein